MEGSKRMRAVLDRRSFLRLGAAGGALAAVGGMATTQGWLAPAQATAAPEERTAFTYHNEHCLCNCMLQCTVRDGRLVMVQPRPNSDKRFQNVCLKGISEIEHIYGEARIQSPMRRVGERGSGQFEVISWDEAFKIIAEKFQATIDKYGSQALWIQYSTEASQRFSPLLASILGAQAGGLNGYDMGQGNGQGQAFGWSGMFALNTIWEWKQANVVLVANCNMLETGMMNGMSATTFEPNGTLTRAQLVTVLYRHAGSPDVTGLPNPFADVAPQSWYAKAVIWAAANGVVKGMSAATFAPEDAITREQIAAILYRYNGEAVTGDLLSSFPDADAVSGYAVEAMQWAVSRGLISGDPASDGTLWLRPRDGATRAQIAKILWVWLGA